MIANSLDLSCKDHHGNTAIFQAWFRIDDALLPRLSEYFASQSEVRLPSWRWEDDNRPIKAHESNIRQLAAAGLHVTIDTASGKQWREE